MFGEAGKAHLFSGTWDAIIANHKIGLASALKGIAESTVDGFAWDIWIGLKTPMSQQIVRSSGSITVIKPSVKKAGGGCINMAY